MIPPFDLTSDIIDMVAVMKGLGVTEAFSRSADFSLMSEHPLKVDNFVHRSVINVHEKGTEAASATGMSIGLMCIEHLDPDPVCINKAFVFQVRYKASKNNYLILFHGRVVDIAKAQ